MADTHKRQASRLPDVSVIDTCKHNHAQNIANKITEVSLKLDCERDNTATDILPIKANAQQTHAFVSVRTSENSSKISVILISEAKYGEARKEWEHPFREYFPNENCAEGNVEES